MGGNQVEENSNRMASASRVDSDESAFNHYNTEVVKLDSNNWREVGALLEPPHSAVDQLAPTMSCRFSVEHDDDNASDEMMRPSYAPDSINVPSASSLSITNQLTTLVHRNPTNTKMSSLQQ